jgi:O-antigen/teichoic acid export membrane protein
MNAISAIGNGLIRLIAKPRLRVALASNFLTHVLTVLVSLASFRVMIVLTDTPTVGLWALIVGFAVMVGVAEMGLGLNMTRYVAAHGNVSRRLIERLVAVGSIMCLFPAALLAFLAAWPIYSFAATRPDLPVMTGEVAVLTGLALVATFVNAANAIFSGLAEGLGRISQRSASSLFYNLVTLGSLWPAVSSFGPVGIGVANLAGVVAQLIMTLAILCIAARKLPRIARDETVGALLRILFASTMQNFGIVLIRLAIDPVARFYVALVGSLTVQAWFELALRASSQVRAVVYTSLQPLLFVGASDQEALPRRFERSRAFTVRLSAFLYLGLACISPLISAVVLGRIEPGFILFLVILGAGGALTTNGLPGYFGIAARGQFGTILKVTFATALLNIMLGGFAILLGAGPIGVVAGLAGAWATSGIVFQDIHARVAGESLWSHFRGFWRVGFMAVVVGGGLALAALRLTPTAVVLLALMSCLLLILPANSLAQIFLRKQA